MRIILLRKAALLFTVINTCVVPSVLEHEGLNLILWKYIPVFLITTTMLLFYSRTVQVSNYIIYISAFPSHDKNAYFHA